MHLEADDDICTILWLRSFDHFEYEDSEMNQPYIDNDYYEYPVPKDFAAFKNTLCTLVEKHDKVCISTWGYDGRHCQRLGRMAVVMAATSHLQITAEKHLKQLGFVQSGPFQKEKHSGSDLSIWIMPAKEFAEAIGYDG